MLEILKTRLFAVGQERASSSRNVRRREGEQAGDLYYWLSGK
jgi:hypothetical protein